MITAQMNEHQVLGELIQDQLNIVKVTIQLIHY